VPETQHGKDGSPHDIHALHLIAKHNSPRKWRSIHPFMPRPI
jgi:hypothetical protein